MKKKHFYSHIIETSSLSLELGDMDMAQEERLHLMALIESNMHQVVVERVLSELSEEDKKTFLQHLASDDHDRIWELLNKKVDNVEEKIKNVAEDLKKELHKDIDEIKKKS